MLILRLGGWWAVVLALVVLTAGPPRGDPGPNAAAERIDALIAQLGAPSYNRREAASKELVTVGEKALPGLRVAATNADPEVRERARQLRRTIMLAARKSKSLGLETVLFEPGEFLMGSPGTEFGRRADETQHRVRITRPFLIGAYEVTQDEYRKVMKVNPSHFAATGPGKDGLGKRDPARFPVERVTWFEAVEFCNRLSAQDGYGPYYTMTAVTREKDAITAAVVTAVGGNGFRLPTEAEWEYACRAGTDTPFHFGYQNSGKEANLRPGPAIGYGSPSWTSLGRSTTVGEYKPNVVGLYDAHGNASEWCWDWYDKDYYLTSPTDDPTGPATGTHRVMRGGSWLLGEGSCRSACRASQPPGEGTYTGGFRVARTP